MGSNVPPKLSIELVPKPLWYINLRSALTPSQWDTLRKACYKRAGHKCEICGGKGQKWPVECHEIWEYDDIACVQTLVGLIALCPDCHQVKHIGFAEQNGKLKEAMNHLAKVNQWPEVITREYVIEQFALWKKRSQFSWKCDLSWSDK